MSTRGLDKRTPESLEKFKEALKACKKRKLAFVYIDDKMTDYIVTSDGMVYKLNLNTGIIKNVIPHMCKDGHLMVGINKTLKGIHQLVAKAFIPNPENKPQVHHIDGDPFNNDVKNLMWVTHKEHVILTKELGQYKGVKGSANKASKFTEEQIELACKLLSENACTIDEICKRSGITLAVLKHLMHRDSSWSHVKDKYDISKFNKFRRRVFSPELKEKFVKLRNEHPEYTLKRISQIIDTPYTNVKQWNRMYPKPQ